MGRGELMRNDEGRTGEERRGEEGVNRWGREERKHEESSWGKYGSRRVICL